MAVFSSEEELEGSMCQSVWLWTFLSEPQHWGSSLSSLLDPWELGCEAFVLMTLSSKSSTHSVFADCCAVSVTLALKVPHGVSYVGPHWNSGILP